jgi:hypothetical protein
MADELKVVEPDPIVPASKVKPVKQDATSAMLDAASEDSVTDMSPDNELDKKAFWTGFCEKCAALNVNALDLYKHAKEQKKIKSIHQALKRDKPVVSPHQKSLIAKNTGEAPQYKDRPKQPPFDTWTENQWNEFVKSTGHKIKK